MPGVEAIVSGWDLRIAGCRAVSEPVGFDMRLCSIPGFASRELRYLVHELCNQVGIPRYLEVGVFFGATFGAAMNNKTGVFIGVENFESFQDGVKLTRTDGALLETGREAQRLCIHSVMATFGKGQTIFCEQDFRAVCPEWVKEKTGGVNVFFYDGEHSAKATEEGIVHFFPAFADGLILIVDDYNAPEVVVGVQKGLSRIPFMVEDHLLFKRRESEKDPYNYGVYTAVLRRL